MKLFDVQQFVGDARELAKETIPFRDQGSNPETGMDCINVVRYLYEKQGLVLPDELVEAFRAYHPTTDGHRMMELMRRWLNEVEIDQAQVGDLYLFRTKQATRHVAIIVERDPVWVVEAYDKKLMDWPLDPLRARVVVGAFRIPETL